MDTHTAHDSNNPINWDGKEPELCELCHNELEESDIKADSKFCEECSYSCCGDELDQDIRICPTCKEHN
jgi:predicted CXXCH cytochrome family protein